eukprot:1677627-Prorocentrum_lima.AAC.1
MVRRVKPRKLTLAECLEDPDFAARYQDWLRDRPTVYPPDLADRNHRVIPYDALFTENQLQDMRSKWAHDHNCPELLDHSRVDDFVFVPPHHPQGPHPMPKRWIPRPTVL